MKPPPGEQVGKYLCYVLRHRPEALRIELNAAGWTEVEGLLNQLSQRKGWHLTPDDLRRVVEEDAKGRFSLQDGRVRANQGHSVAGVMAVELHPVEPPEVLFHGTTRQRWEMIQASGGLKPMNRHHVHLSSEYDTAWKVGARHRKETPMVLEVQARAMAETDAAFYLSENGVWMADRVLLSFLREATHD